MPYSAALTLDPATLPDEPLPDDHPVLVHGLPAPEYMAGQEMAEFEADVSALTDMQRRLVTIMYAMYPSNNSKAAILAGYSTKNATTVASRAVRSAQVGKVWAALAGSRLPAGRVANSAPLSKAEALGILAEIIRTTPDDTLKAIADLAHGKSSPETRSPAYNAVKRISRTNTKGVTQHEIELKMVDKLGALKLMGSWLGYEVKQTQLDGTQETVQELYALILQQQNKSGE